MSTLAFDALSSPGSIRAGGVSLEDLTAQAEQALSYMNSVKDRIWEPGHAKVPPLFTANTVAQFAGLDNARFLRRISKGDLPSGTLVNKSRREFTVDQTQVWSRAYDRAHVRAEGERGFVLVTANNKGGVSKTTTTMALSQGLTLRGYRVLCIDLDPQGNLTSMAGFAPHLDVDDDDTALPLCDGSQTSLRYAVRPTYWPNLDLVPAQPSLFGAEFMLPMRQRKMLAEGFRFWDVLRAGLYSDGLVNEYDIIIIDTSPAMSYLAMNGFGAADGVLVPVPPNGLDYASSVQFLNLFAELMARFVEDSGSETLRRFVFFDVLPVKVRAHEASHAAVLQWINGSYGGLVLPTQIPDSAVISATGTRFSTVFDIAAYEGSRETFRRARDAYESLVTLVEQKIRANWPSAQSAS